MNRLRFSLPCPRPVRRVADAPRLDDVLVACRAHARRLRRDERRLLSAVNRLRTLRRRMRAARGALARSRGRILEIGRSLSALGPAL